MKVLNYSFRFVVVCVISLLLVSCANKPKTVEELNKDISSAEIILKDNEMLKELRVLAEKDYLEYTQALQGKPLADLLAPINAKFDIFQATFERSKLDPQEDGKNSIIFAAIACYYKEARIKVTEDGSCGATDKDGNDISSGFLSTVAAVPANVGPGGAVTMAVEADKIQQLLTYDPNSKDLLKTLYMFGDERFDLLYVITVSAKVKSLTEASISNPMVMMSQGKEVIAGGTFVKNLFQVLGQAGETGGEIVSKVTEKLSGGAPAAE